MMTLLMATLSFTLAAAAEERPAIVVEAAQAPARISRATVLTPAEGPPVVLYAAVSQSDAELEVFTVKAFVFRADGTLKATQVAPGRRTLAPRETKYSTLVLDGSKIEPSDQIVIGIDQAQDAATEAWWRTDLQPAAEAKVPLKKK